MADDANVTYRIPKVQGNIIIAVYAITDLVQLLLNLTGFLAVIAISATVLIQGIIMLWFMWKGVTYTSGKKALFKFLTVLGTWVIEIIPILDALPMLTIGAILTIHASRVEDRLNAKQNKSSSTPQAANDNERQGEYAQAA